MKTTAVLSAIRESNDDELVARRRRLEDELFQHKLKRHTNQLENTNVIRATRREIARVHTVLVARKHGLEAKGAAAEAAATGGEAKPASKKAAAPKAKSTPKTTKKAAKE